MKTTYEKRIREREQQTPLFYYDYEIKPISRYAKSAFEGKKLDGRYTFHFDDPKAQNLETVKDAAIRYLAYQGTYGIRHRDVTSKTFLIPLTRRSRENIKSKLLPGEDYEIVIGEKIMIKQRPRLTFDDIK